MGLAPDSVLAGVWLHLGLTVIGAMGSYLLVRWLYPGWKPFPLQSWMVLVSLFLSFVQELVFRTFMIQALLDRGWSRGAIVWLTSFTFSFIHIIYPQHTILFMILTFAFSVIASLLYLRYRNLYLVTLCHFVLNLLVLYLGLHT